MIGKLLKVAGTAAAVVVIAASAAATAPAAVAAGPGITTPQAGIAAPQAGIVNVTPPADQLIALSCASSSFCMAIGGFSPLQPAGTNFTEVWHGSSWQVVPSSVGNLQQVSCVSASFCMAAGIDGGQTWNGTSWKAVPNSPEVLGVDCVSSTFCMAAGTGGPSAATMHEWDGSAWHTQNFAITCPPFHGGCSTALTRVDCLSTTFCMTIGSIGADTPQSISATWNGAGWTQQAVPTVGTHSANLVALSCTSATFCLAVGQSRFGPAATAMAWDGSGWQPQTAPDLTGPSQISCTSTTACLAAGGGAVESWTGSSWQSFASPAIPGATTTITGLSCAGSPLTRCMLAGYYASPSIGSLTLAEQWAGASWQAQHTPSPGAVDGLLGVSCVSAQFCMGVGTTIGTGDVQRATAELWNGVSWAAESAVSPGVQLNYLSGVSCLTRFYCVAVGSFDNVLGHRQTLAEQWNGTSWSQLNSLNTELNDQLAAVSCAVQNNCVAVGTSSVPNRVHTLAEQWNGSTWRITSTPDPGSTHPVEQFNYLSGISCTGPKACIAVGDFNKRLPHGQRPLAIAWNGSGWRLLRTPGSNGELAAVSCLSASRCMAVGADTNSQGQPARTLAQQWNGSTWTQRWPAPLASGKAGHLDGVSCTSSSFCLAVGSFTTTGGQVHTLGQVWNGSSWRLIVTPNPSPAFSAMYADGCTKRLHCIAVGEAVQHPLTGLWNGARWAG